MATVKRNYAKEDFARRGDAIHTDKIVPQLDASDTGRIVAIDVVTAEFEIASDELTACDRLRARLPAAQIWLVRIGRRYVHFFGSRQREAHDYGHRAPRSGMSNSVFAARMVSNKAWTQSLIPVTPVGSPCRQSWWLLWA